MNHCAQYHTATLFLFNSKVKIDHTFHSTHLSLNKNVPLGNSYTSINFHLDKLVNFLNSWDNMSLLHRIISRLEKEFECVCVCGGGGGTKYYGQNRSHEDNNRVVDKMEMSKIITRHFSSTRGYTDGMYLSQM